MGIMPLLTLMAYSSTVVPPKLDLGSL